MAKKLNWDRVHSEDLGRRRGYHDIGSNPPPPNPPTPPKCNPPEPNPPKNKCKVVPADQISGYLGCDHDRLVKSLQHLAEDSAAVEVTPGVHGDQLTAPGVRRRRHALYPEIPNRITER